MTRLKTLATLVALFCVAYCLAEDEPSLLERVQAIEEREHVYKVIIATLQGHVERQDATIRRLEATNRRTHRTLANLIERLQSLEHGQQQKPSASSPEVVETPMTTIQSNQSDIPRQNNNLSDTTATTSKNKQWRMASDDSQTVHEKKKLQRRLVSDTVAFLAVNHDATIEHIGLNQYIPFPTVKLNIGNGYHQNLNVFVATLGGIYMFSSSLMTLNRGCEAQASIYKNGMVLSRIFSEGTLSSSDQGSVTVMTQLDVGDEVFVRYDWPADGELNGNGFTSFSGALIFPL